MAEPDEGLYRFPSLLRVEHAMFLLVLSGPGFPPQPRFFGEHRCLPARY